MINNSAVCIWILCTSFIQINDHTWKGILIYPSLTKPYPGTPSRGFALRSKTLCSTLTANQNGPWSLNLPPRSKTQPYPPDLSWGRKLQQQNILFTQSPSFIYTGNLFCNSLSFLLCLIVFVCLRHFLSLLITHLFCKLSRLIHRHRCGISKTHDRFVWSHYH